MTDQFVDANKMMPITPPPEMVRQWCHEDGDEIKTSPRWYQIVCAKAACWGADQELKACCDAVYSYEGSPIHGGTAEWLRTARRPKPPSPKEKALKVLEALIEWQRIDDPEYQALRHALEQLDD